MEINQSTEYKYFHRSKIGHHLIFFDGHLELFDKQTFFFIGDHKITSFK